MGHFTGFGLKPIKTSGAGQDWPDDSVAAQFEHFEAGLAADLAAELREERLAHLVGGSWRADLVDPLVLGVVVDHQLFDEAVDCLYFEATRRCRRFKGLFLKKQKSEMYFDLPLGSAPSFGRGFYIVNSSRNC